MQNCILEKLLTLGPISFWGYKEQESTLILPEHDDDDDYDTDIVTLGVQN